MLCGELRLSHHCCLETWLAGIQYAERAEPILAVDSGLLAYHCTPSNAVPPGPILDAMQIIAQCSPEAALLFGATAHFLCLDRLMNDRGPGGICEPSWPGGLDESRAPVLLTVDGIIQALEYNGQD